MQTRAFGTSFVAVRHEPTPEAMQPLRDHLLKFYTPEHRVTYITSAAQPDRRADRLSFELKDLGGSEESPQIPGASLFIPAAVGLAPDPDFVAGMTDRSRFASAYREPGAARSTADTVDHGAQNPKYGGVVLLSGGVDSAVLMHHMARSSSAPVVALHLAGIGSRQETVAATRIAAEAGIDLHTIEMSSFFEACKARPSAEQVGHRAVLAATTVYTAALAFAQARGIGQVAIGLHSGDSAAWVEQSPAFLDLIQELVRSVGGECELVAPFHGWSKTEVLKHGIGLGVDLSETWSCLSSTGRWQDGSCQACLDRRAAFECAGIVDMTPYVDC